MRDYRFDLLARSLTRGLSRRRSLGLLASLGLPNLVPLDAAAAKKKKKPCPPCKKRKQGKCKRTLPDGTACGGGTCQRGSCIAATPPPTGGDPVVPVCGAGKACAGPDDCILGGGMCECKVRADNPNATCCGQPDPGCGTLGIWCTATNTQCPDGMFCTPCQQAGGFFCTFNCA